MISLEKSKAAFEEARLYMPGGVNSPVRSYPHMGCPPPFIKEAKGSHITDIDGKQAVRITYATQFPGYPVAINDEYYFYNGHKIYRVRIMIRSTEYQLWTEGNNDIRNIVKTLKLIV